MAFLRRGLVTNKGAVPSLHTRQQVIRAVVVANDEMADPQPVIQIRSVTKIIKMGNARGDHHIVQLSCGHTVQSKSTFQGYCKQCKH